jgi:photosystem II stability/assembly factor-like uncharacterized protein
MFRRDRSVPLIALLLVASCSAPPPVSSASSAPPPVVTERPSPTPAAPTGSTSAATPIPMPSFAQVSAPSSDVVWILVAATRLFRSIDRGATWEERFAWLGPCCSGREISFIDDREGWLASAGQPGTQCTFQSVGIAQSVDAGATWDQFFVPVPPSSTDPTGLAGRQCKTGLVFADARRGFLSGGDPNAPPMVFRTVDGGRSWTASRPLPDPPGFTTRGAGFVLQAGRVHPFAATLLVAASASIDGRQTTYAFRSVDGGASWTYVATFPEPGGAVAFVTASRWLQITMPGGSKETTDSGATWHDFTTDYSQAAPIAPVIVFADALVGYATVRGGIQRTVDGGAHWTGLATPGT